MILCATQSAKWQSESDMQDRHSPVLLELTVQGLVENVEKGLCEGSSQTFSVLLFIIRDKSAQEEILGLAHSWLSIIY